MSESTPTPSEGSDKLEGIADGGADGVPGIQDGGADGGADSGADGGAFGATSSSSGLGADGGSVSGADLGASDRVPLGALTSARQIGVPLEALILVRMWARGRDRTSVPTSGRDRAQTLERMLEPMPRSPAQDSAPAARPHLMRVRQPVRALVRLGHLLLPQAFRERSTPEQTAVPIVGPLATGARTAGL